MPFLRRLFALFMTLALVATGVGVALPEVECSDDEPVAEQVGCCDSDRSANTDDHDACPTTCDICPRCAGVVAVLAAPPRVVACTFVVRVEHAVASTGPRDGVRQRLYTPPRSRLS